MTETAVIGAGTAGVAAAYYLMAGGAADVTVVESDEVGSGATAASFGGVRQQFSTDLEIELSKLGLAFWKSAGERLDPRCVFDQTGYLVVTSDQAQLDRLTFAAGLQRSLDAGPVRLLLPDEVSQVAPWLNGVSLAGGCWTPEDGRVNVVAGVMALARLARALGARIREHWQVSAIRRRPGGYEVIGPAGSIISARHVIVAAGLLTPRLLAPLGYHIDIYPKLLHRAVMVGSTAPLRGPLTIDLDTGLWVEPLGVDVAVSILLERPPENYGPEQMLADWRALAPSRAPSLAGLAARHVTSASADGVSDGHPNAGEIDAGLWVLAGFAGHGTMHGPVIAQLVAEQVLGTYDGRLDLSPLHPLRRPARDQTEEWMVGRKQ